MKDMFIERLRPILPLEQLELGADILDFFETVGFTSPYEPLQEIMEVSTSNIDTVQYASRILTTLSDSLDDLLLAFGVEVTESCPIAFKRDLGRTLAELPFYYLPAEVLAIIEGTYQPDVILAELVQLTRGVAVEESLDYIFNVNEAVIPKIVEEMRKLNDFAEAISQEELVNLDRRRIINLNRLLRDPRAKEHLSCLRELVDSGSRTGADYEALVHQYAEELTLKPADHMTVELLGLALFSNLPAEQWIDATHKAAGEFTDLLSDHRKIEIVLNDYRTFFEM